MLDRAEALRAKRRAALAQLDSLTQSIFLDLFGDPMTNPKGWELRAIGDELKLQGGYAFKSSDYTHAGIRLVKISNVHKDNLEWSDIDHLPSGHLEEFSDFSLCPGDVVLALTRPISVVLLHDFGRDDRQVTLVVVHGAATSSLSTRFTPAASSKQFGELGLQGAMAGDEINVLTLTPCRCGDRPEPCILGRGPRRIAKGTTIHYRV